MSAEPPERDPLADLVSRSLGTRVESVREEELPGDDGVERRRLRFVSQDAERSVVFERSPRAAAIEAQLLPFLARKTDRVPLLHSRGLPPPHAALGHWVLIEDVLAAPSACDADPADVVRAKLAIERAVEHDEPALRALGVPIDPRELPPALAALPRRLAHGDLRCAAAHRVERGVVITGWARASLGCVVLDVAALARDLATSGREDGAGDVRETYARESGLASARELLALAEAVLSRA